VGMELDQNMSHYEILGVSENASVDEIESTYERLISEIDTDYLALYSMVDESEMDERRHRVQVAYEVLRDAGRRARYDENRGESMGGYPSLTVSERSASVSNAAASLTVAEQRADESVTHTGATLSSELTSMTSVRQQVVTKENTPPSSPRAKTPSGGGGRRVILTAEVLDKLTADTEFSGELLKRLRETAGLSLEDMAMITKISKRYLRAIEGDDFATLPAKVYIRGFVGQYARVLGLDSGRVAQSFLSLVERGLQEG